MTRIYFIILMLVFSFFYCSKRENKEDLPKLNPIDKTIIDTPRIFLPGNISLDKSDEFGISFTPDMQQLFFTSNRVDSTFYIYTSTLEKGQWSEPTIAPFSGNYFDADAFVTLDGQRVYFFSMRPKDGQSEALVMPNIWYVERNKNHWSSAEILVPNINGDTSGEGYMSISKDHVIYFSSVGREEGKLHDIYKAVYKNGTFQAPEWVEVEIKTNFSNPYIASDESFLIIDSEQNGGYGGNDLYISYRENNNWSQPKNLGSIINTKGDEGTPYFTPDGQWFFFSRDGDIYYLHRSNLNLE